MNVYLTMHTTTEDGKLDYNAANWKVKGVFSTFSDASDAIVRNLRLEKTLEWRYLFGAREVHSVYVAQDELKWYSIIEMRVDFYKER